MEEARWTRKLKADVPVNQDIVLPDRRSFDFIEDESDVYILAEYA